MYLQASPVSLRGITTAGINLGIVVGQLLSNAAVKAFGERADKWAYRAPFALQLLFVGKLDILLYCAAFNLSDSRPSRWPSLRSRVTLVSGPHREIR